MDTLGACVVHLVWDGLALAGAALVAGGLWLLHPSAALVGLGGGLIGLAVLGAKRWK